ncbi:Wzy polymerase domain-containing protein [Undibacterium sp. Ren11W]|uniref:PglL family O-oligosaccharyltransferase n=1 Tax=Undibacterium sp. Ren11W TaxID=3413045 RepID=UPI003BF29BF6
MFALHAAPRLRLPLMLLLPLGLILFLLLQWGVGLVSFEAVAIPVMYFLMFAAALVLGATWAQSGKGARDLCLMLALAHLLAALLSVVMQGVQISGIDASPWIMYMARASQMRPYANVAQPNQLALLLCLGLASVWYLFQTFRLGRWEACLLSLTLLWGMALTQSRIGWIIMPLFVMYCFIQRHGARIIDKRCLLLLLALYAAMVMGLPAFSQLMGFSSGSVADHLGGRSERSVLLKQAFSMAHQHPWFGVGWFGFGAEQVGIAADFSSTTYAEHAHNLLLNFAAELGWPATVVFIGSLVWWFWQTCGYRSERKDISVGFAALCLIAVAVHSMVEFPLWYAYVLMPVGLLMGMLHQLRWSGAGRDVPRAAILATSLAVALILVLLTADYQRVVNGFNILRTGKTYTETDTQALTRPQFTLFGEYFCYFDVMRMTPHEGMSAAEIDAVEQMSRRFGFVHILNKLAEVYVLNGQAKKAERMMLTLQRLHPYSYPEYFDYWKSQAEADQRYAAVFVSMPKRDAE